MTDSTMLASLIALVDASGTMRDYPRLDDFGSTAPAVAVQMLPGSRWAEQYVDGSGTRAYPFAVRVRVPAVDTAARIDVFSSMTALAAYLEDEGNMDEGISRVAMTGTPSRVALDAKTGTEEWRATFVLECSADAV